MSPLLPPSTDLLDRFRGDAAESVYTAVVHVAGGEAQHARSSGIARSDDDALNVQLRLPTAMGGDGSGTNPEQLLAAGYATCFHGALMLLAARDCIVLPPLNIVASVSFARDPVDGLFLLTAQMRVELPGADRAIAEELVRNTERLCPYAKMFRQGIAFGVNVVV